MNEVNVGTAGHVDHGHVDVPGHADYLASKEPVNEQIPLRRFNVDRDRFAKLSRRITDVKKNAGLETKAGVFFNLGTPGEEVDPVHVAKVSVVLDSMINALAGRELTLLSRDLLAVDLTATKETGSKLFPNDTGHRATLGIHEVSRNRIVISLIYQNSERSRIFAFFRKAKGM